MDEWRREWRRNGGGLMGATFLVGGTWLSASQTFVAQKDGQLVHPSPWGWLLYVCIAGFALGCYIVATTYVDQLPMPGRKAATHRDWAAQSAKQWERLEERSDRLGRHDAVRVELVERAPRAFLTGPESYQTAQLLQAIRALREAEFEWCDREVLAAALRKLKRTDTNPLFEPMGSLSFEDGLKKLVELGELEGPDHRLIWTILPEGLADD